MCIHRDLPTRRPMYPHMPSRILIVLAAVIATLSLYTPPRIAFAQVPKTIAYDVPVTGHITDAAPTESWTLTAPGKDVISISAQRTDGTLVPKVELLDSTGKLVAQAEHDDTAAQATIASMQLPGPDTYTITVGRYQDKNGKTSDGYELLINLIGAGPDRPDMYKTLENNSIIDDLADNHTTRRGTLTNAHWAEAYFWYAVSKERIFFQATRVTHLTTDLTPTPGFTLPAMRIADTLRPTLMLVQVDQIAWQSGKSLNELVQNSPIVKQAATGPDGATASLDVVLPAPGIYLLVVSRIDNEKGVTTGRYGLAVNLLGSNDEDVPLSEILGYSIRVGQPSHGFIGGSRWRGKFVLQLDKTAPLTITAKRTSGTVLLIISVFDESGKQLVSAEHDDTFEKTTINRFIPPAPGTYTIVVFREGKSMGDTDGEYELTVSPAAQ